MLGKQTDHLKRFQYWLSMSLVYTNVFTQMNENNVNIDPLFHIL